MTTAPATRASRRKARTTQAILAAAEEIFLAHGYHESRVEDIAERADVAVGSVYGHFGSKAGLYLAVVEGALDVEEAYLADALAHASSPTEQLRRTGEAYVRFYLEHPGYFRLLASPPADGRRRSERGAEMAERLSARASRLIEQTADIITRAVALGEARAVDPDAAAKFLWGAWTGVITLHLRPDALALTDDELQGVLAAGRSIVADGLWSKDMGT